MFKNILVPLDGSALAEKALGTALALATDADSKLLLFQAIIPEEIFVSAATAYEIARLGGNDREHQVEAEGYLLDVVKTHQHPNVFFETAVGFGTAAEGIVDSAADRDIDLIVMTTHGRSGVSRWLLGSVAEKVLQKAPCPVLVVRDDAPLDHIMVTLDGSPLAELALDPAFEMARRLGARVTLLRVESDIPSLDRQAIGALDALEPGLGEIVQNDYVNRAQYYLTELQHRYAHQGVPITSAIRVGDAAGHILRTLEENDVELLALATHGRSGLGRWVFGSVTHKMLRRAPCSLLVVRPS